MLLSKLSRKTVIGMESLDREKFGRFLCERRKTTGLTQRELGARLFVSNKAVSKWERGQSLPDISLLRPLAEILGVNVTELLNGGPIEKESLSGREAQTLVDRAIEFSREQSAEKRRKRRWQTLWSISLILSLAEAAALLLRGEKASVLGYSVFLVQGLCLFFGLWTCFFMKERLPSFYDENKLSYVSDGIFRMDLAGIYFNNNNWPHIVKALRIWTVLVPVLFPFVFLLLKPWWNGAGLAASLLGCLGLFIPVAIMGKKYE